MKLSNTLAILFSSSLLALAACGTSTIGGGSGAGGSGSGGTGAGAGPTGLTCNGAPSPLSCAADSACPAGYRCVEDADPTTCHPSHCSCTADGWACTADCGMGGRSCVEGGPPVPVDCSGAGPNDFPAFDKSCTADSECVAKLHQINCCGTLVAIGINASGSAAFDAAEATCQGQYPACGCAQMPTTAEDGKTLADYGSDFPVVCKAGQCTTYSPDAALCNGAPSPVNCNDKSCPDGFTCTLDPDPTTCHPSDCTCENGAWGCSKDCQTGGSTCVKGL